ncbi:MAG TPA: two-component regulator propeller domain-containing protein, partial [Paludibacter sp.]
MTVTNSSTANRLFLGFLFLFCCVFLAARGEQQTISFEAITNDKGLSHNTVYDICQDSQGFMWFATDEGLDRYDGKNIKQYFSRDNNLLPSNSIRSLANTIDKKLFVATSKGLTLYRPYKDDFVEIKNNKHPLGEIISIQEGNPGDLLIATQNQGAFIYKHRQNKFIRLAFLNERVYGLTKDRMGFYWAFTRFSLIRFNSQLKIIGRYMVGPDLFNSAISYMKSDQKGILWVGTFQAGLFTFNFETATFSPFVPSNKVDMYFIRTIEEGENPNEYWIGTEKGLYILNIQSGHFEHYTQSFDVARKTINDNAVYTIYRNRQNVFFVGTYFGGVNIAKRRRTGFNAIYPNDNSGSLHGKALSNIAQSPTGELWIATEDAGIAIYNLHKRTFTHILAGENTSSSISTNNVHVLLMDKNICWAGHFLGGLSKIDCKTHTAKRFLGKNGDPASLSNNFVFALHHYSPDTILVGTIAGIDIFDKRTEKFSRFRQEELNDCFVYEIFKAPDGKIWICTYNKGIFILDKTKRGLMAHYQAGDKSGLPGNSIISYCIDSQKQIWIGTRGSGLCLFSLANQTFKTYTDKNLLINNVVYGILEDKDKNLWISSNKGISRLNIQDNSSIHFNLDHGIAGNQYNYKSYFKTADGYMFFGSVAGLTNFHPDLIRTPDVAPTVHFTNFKIFNETVLPSNKQVLKNNIDFSDKIKLKYNQNSFTLEFTSINYFDGNVSFQYYLEGLENTWSPLTERMQANYTNLSPGKYIFHIRATNKISKQTSEARTIEFIISPPIWASWIAYSLYAIFFLLIAWWLYKSYINRQHEKVALTIEKIEKENLKLLHQHKMNFFTYISHEFKTPLSIIIASVELLFQKETNNQQDENEEIHHTIKRSATRLLTLVNQLMEFRKIETDHAVIHVHKGDVVDFFHQIVTFYRPLLEKKNIDLKIQIQYETTDIFFDFDKLEKIFTNLLTNAVKYTPDHGEIILQLNVRTNDFYFSVKDSGKGLSPMQIERIFEVFYGEEESKELVESSGIGLALTASLVKLLKGQINVESELGQGSKFIITLPMMENVEGATTYERQISTSDIMEIIPIDYQNEKPIDSNREKQFSLVIVEDNKDLLNLLSKKLREKYAVKSFENGLDAWNYIQVKTPDVVITDVMMPVMSGIELCEKIKTNIDLCHIPVVMLTAKTTNEAKMEGLQVGADMYIPKPFSIEELELRLNNILKVRIALKNKLAELSKIEGFNIPSSNKEQAFIEKVFALIHENIHESDLDVQLLADKLNISRTNLHNRIKNTM